VRGGITSIEVAWTFFKFIILKRGTLGQMAAQLGDAFTLAHKLDFGKAKLLALGQILGRFIGQIGLPKSAVHNCLNHDGLPPRVILSHALKAAQSMEHFDFFHALHGPM
jgi:hypothetical protein